MLPREGPIQHCSRFPHNLKGHFHNVQRTWCPASEGGGCLQTPCSREPLKWHLPWLLNRTGHLQKEKWWHLHHKSEEKLGEASAGSLCHWFHWKPCCQCHIIQEYWSANCAEVCCCRWSHSYVGHFTPGTLPNQIQAAFQEPRLAGVTDPRADYQPFTEVSYVNLPTIALCITDSPLRYVDTAIPCKRGAHSLGLMQWMLAQEVLCTCGTISR